MRLFLASQDLGRYGKKARELAGNNPKLGYIKNSQDDKTPEERNFSTPAKKVMFEQFGFEFEEIDLREYFGKSDELLMKVSELGSVFCAGGNTFILRRAMRASGLDEIIKSLLEQDKIMYGGWSAGACVTAESLNGIQFGDRPGPQVVPVDYPDDVRETIWEGLGLIKFMLIPHCDMDWFKRQAEETEKYMKKNKITYKTFNDGQVYVVDGEKEEMLI